MYEARAFNITQDRLHTVALRNLRFEGRDFCLKSLHSDGIFNGGSSRGLIRGGLCVGGNVGGNVSGSVVGSVGRNIGVGRYEWFGLGAGLGARGCRVGHILHQSGSLL